METNHYEEAFPAALQAELEANGCRELERKTMIVLDEASRGWVLFACVLRPLRPDAAPPAQVLDYGRAVLKVDSLEVAQLPAFLNDIANKLCDLTGKTVSSKLGAGCGREAVPLENVWMERPGAVYSWRPVAQPNPPAESLLRPLLPYYPDVYEAAKDWLELHQYHGQSDGRRGQVMLLLPETRAFFGEHSWADDDEHLHLQVSGRASSSGDLQLKGAYWRRGVITQVNERVNGSAVVLHVPRDVDRIELFLLAADGTVFDRHVEQLGWGAQQRFLASRHRMTSNRIADALKQGEGAQIEFKSFIELPKHKTRLAGESKAKMDEVLETVAAFSNADGGTIFLGISNDVRVVGISEGLVRWSGELVSRDTLDGYAQALRAYIRDEMYLPVNIDVSVLEHESEFIVVVEVPRSATTLVSLKKDARLFRRHGASNKAVPPEEWKPTGGIALSG
jgi:hypothetical protein